MIHAGVLSLIVVPSSGSDAGSYSPIAKEGSAMLAMAMHVTQLLLHLHASELARTMFAPLPSTVHRLIRTNARS